MYLCIYIVDIELVCITNLELSSIKIISPPTVQLKYRFMRPQPKVLIPEPVAYKNLSNRYIVFFLVDITSIRIL